MRWTAAMITSASVLAISTAASAQTAPIAGGPTEVGEVIVTGTRIVRDGYEAPTPVTVATTEELEAATPTNLSDALNQLPQFSGSVGPTSQGFALPRPGAHGGNFLALRNLESVRTLLMMDGRRLPPTNFQGLVDAGIVPELLVRRVDVVTGGASAVYGSDAVAGVVNYILDRSFTGLKAKAQFGFSNYRGTGYTDLVDVHRDKPWLSDGKSYRVGLAGGAPFLDGRAHVLVSYERSNQDPVVRADRPHALESWGFGSLPNAGSPGTATNPWFLSRDVVRNDFNYSGKFVSGPVNNMWLSDDGTFIRPWDDGIRTGVGNLSIGGDGEYSPQLQALIAGLTTDQAFGQIRYDLTDAIEASLTATYSKSEGEVDTGGVSIASFRYFSGNPFLPEPVQDALTENNTPSVLFRKRQVDNYPLEGEETNEAWTVTTALEGRVFGDWLFDAYYTYADTNNAFATEQPESRKWFAAMDAVVDPDTGETVCYVTLTNPDLYPGCAPYNPFGRDNASDAAKAYILGISTSDATHVAHFFGANIAGELFSLPAGPVSVALGAEYRKLKLDLISNADPEEPIDFTGLRNLPARTPARFYLTNTGEAHGSTDVKEVFGELVVPLLRDAPLVESLEFAGAVRRTEYEHSGGVTTWKTGLTYEPVADLTVRAALSRDIRAPTLFEMFATETGIRGLPFDPHTGVTDSAITFTGGNPNLKPEIADTMTIGVVYQPAWLPRFGISIDYYDIEIDGAVGQQSARAILDDCEASNGTAATCDLIDRPFPFENRNPENFFSGVHVRPLNLSFIKTSGVDLDARYSFDIEDLSDRFVGNVSLRAFVNYVDTYQTKLTATSPVNDEAGCTCGPLPQWRALVSSTYANGGFKWRVQGRYIGELKAGPQVFIPDGIEDYLYFDTTVSYATELAGHETEAFLTINNVFNKIYPIWGGTGAVGASFPTIPQVYDVMLRYFTVGVRLRY